MDDRKVTISRTSPPFNQKSSPSGSEMIGFKARPAATQPMPTLGALELAEHGLADIRRLMENVRRAIIGSNEENENSVTDLHRRARLEIKNRQSRNALLGDDLFSDPAWDILLLLFAELPLRKHLLIKEFALRARVPLTTTIRWLYALENRGLIWRCEDERDRRATNVGLTERGRDLMATHFAD